MLQLFYTKLNYSDKQALIDAIVETCEVRQSTAASWCNGKRTPRALDQQAIAKITGCDRFWLFPISPEKNKFQTPTEKTHETESNPN